jgi:ribonuclease HII
MLEHGVDLVGGVDEAGRGCLAGPVVAAAVVVDADFHIDGLNDSKKLSARKREKFYPMIQKDAKAAAIGWASTEEVDRLNVLMATHLAARRALDALAVQPPLLLTDYLKLRDFPAPLEALVDGDARSQAIAAASILAKVARDHWMRALEAEFPEYGFAVHKGYGVPLHLNALTEHGPCTIHRRGFRGVDWFGREANQSRTLRRLLGELESGALDSTSIEDAWLRDGFFLPDCEFEILRKAAGK